MESTNPQQSVTYDAFISYSRRDRTFAELLEQALEDYTPPKDLNVPQRHLTVFRDEEDFTGAEYHQSLEKYLTNSAKLIVLCSPHACASTYVNEEISRFAKTKGPEHMIPLLVAGIPNNEVKPGQEAERAFPQALCDALAMPLAANYLGFDPKKDAATKGAYEGSWYTVLANLYGVSRSELEQREEKRKRRERRKRRLRRTVLAAATLVVVLVTFSSFSFVWQLPGHWRPGWNTPWKEGTAPRATPASWQLSDLETQDGRFVGLALSGFGSRAMNFDAAVMLELQDRGLLDQVDVVSAVSGGAVPAALLGLDPKTRGALTRQSALTIFRLNFQDEWIRRWFLPANYVRASLTEFTRSDTIVQVLNAHLYHGATFGDLQLRPKLLLNATVRSNESRFTFTDQTFLSSLRSELAAYQVANAVYASMAIPGVFDDVVLEQHVQPPRYVHLSDGSAADGLGFQALRDYLSQAVEGTNLDTLFPNGCLILVVDPTPFESGGNLEYLKTSPSQSWLDLFINASAMESFVQGTTMSRQQLLADLGIREPDAQVAGEMALPDLHQCRCEVRHIALRHLAYGAESRDGDEELAARVLRSSARLWISAEEQDDLFRAAKLLVQELPAQPAQTRCGTHR